MVKKNNIQVEKVNSRYVLSKTETDWDEEVERDYKISVQINEHGHISIFRQKYFNEGFSFINSDPVVIKNIGELLIEASKLTN
jgi:myo-inositol-1-phosphate synthase